MSEDDEIDRDRKEKGFGKRKTQMPKKPHITHIETREHVVKMA